MALTEMFAKVFTGCFITANTQTSAGGLTMVRLLSSCLHRTTISLFSISRTNPREQEPEAKRAEEKGEFAPKVVP